MLEKERELHQQRIQSRNIQLQNDVLNKSKELAFYQKTLKHHQL